MDKDVRDALSTFTLSDEKRVKEERAALIAQVDELRAGKTTFSAEDVAIYERLDAEIEAKTLFLDAGLKSRKAHDVNVEISGEREERTGLPTERYNEVFVKYLRGGILELDASERAILSGRVDGELQARVQNTLTGGAGGYLVPDGFWNRLVEMQKAYGQLESLANVITTQTGNDIPWLTMDDTANEGELLNEGDQVSALDIAFNTKVLRAYTYSSKLILVSWQLLQDAVIDIEGLIARVAAKRLARIHARHFTTGDGFNKPEGITVGLTGGKAFAGATAITYDELIDIQHILDPAYRTGNERWMFADATLKILRKLVDGQGNKAWQPAMTAGVPDMLLGDPYTVNNSMPAPTTGNVSVLYGDFNAGYIIRRVKGATAVRLNEKYADFLQTGYFVYDRVDGKKDDTAAYTYGIQA